MKVNPTRTLDSVDQTEAYFHQGVILERIMDDDEFLDANYANFTSYVNDRQTPRIKAKNGIRRQ